HFAKSEHLLNKLLSKNCNPNLRDSRGTSVLLHACFSRRPTSLLARLLEVTQDVNVPDNVGATPLSFSIIRHHSLTQILVEHGADVNQSTKDGATPLILASMMLPYAFATP